MVLNFMSQPSQAVVPQVSGKKISVEINVCISSFGEGDSHTVSWSHPSRIMKVDINFLVFCRVYIGPPHLSIQDASPVQQLVFLDSCGPSGEQCRRRLSPNGHTRKGEEQPGQRPLVEKALAGCTNQGRIHLLQGPNPASEG